MDTNITDATGTVIGLIRPVRLAHRETGAVAITYTPAYAADVLNGSGTRWVCPGSDGRTHYPTFEAAREAIHAARAAQTPPALPKGLRLGANQKWALWLASISNGVINDRHGPALAKKGLASDDWYCFTITDQGRQVADQLFDIDGNPR